MATLMKQPFPLREAVVAKGGRHDRSAGVVYGVKVLGLTSKNGRKYAHQAAARAIRMFENAPVYIDHPAEKPGLSGGPVPRLLRDRFARMKNVHQVGSGDLYGDLYYGPKHPFADHFAYLVDNDPEGVGLSINAHGYGTRQSDGTILVDEISRVHSVDLVDGPATATSLWEQTALPTDGTTSIRAKIGDLFKSLALDVTLSKRQVRRQALKLLDLIDREPDPFNAANFDQIHRRLLMDVDSDDTEPESVREQVKRYFGSDPLPAHVRRTIPFLRETYLEDDFSQPCLTPQRQREEVARLAGDTSPDPATVARVSSELFGDQPPDRGALVDRYFGSPQYQ